MRWKLREIQFFLAVVDEGSFTDAAQALLVSQAAVSRTVSTFEHHVGHRLLDRGARHCEPTAVGHQVIPEARRMLAAAERFDRFLSSRQGTLRLGYAWAALGKHNSNVQRLWERHHPSLELALIRSNTRMAGLTEGRCDVAIVRTDVDDERFESEVVGLEQRLVAFATDDAAWSSRRRFRLNEIRERTVAVDPRVGTTSDLLWGEAGPPVAKIETHDVDEWLDSIAAGRGVGITADATAFHHARNGVTFRPISDSPPIPVRLVWHRGEHVDGLKELVEVASGQYAMK